MAKQKITQAVHFKAILGYVGILIHVPGAMALASIVIALVFEEFFAIIPFLCCAFFSFSLGQILYRIFFEPRACHLWDAMIIAALAWIVIPFMGALPYYWIAERAVLLGDFATSVSEMATFPNTMFESFSAFTSTGLSVVDQPEVFPKSFQWWRSFSCWIGGTGLIVFVLSITQPGRGEYRLYYSEARNETVGEDVGATTRIIAILYAIYTILGIFAYYIAGMPLWEAINHSMTSLSTGGFTIISSSFSTYNDGIKLIGIILMLIGATSFALHYRIIKERRISLLFTNLQQAVYLIILVVGGGVSYLLMHYSEQSIGGLNVLFNFVSASSTCGFSASTVALYLPNLKLMLILAMLLGGCAGSTAGGIKVQRFHDLLEGVYVRMQSMTEERERYIKAVNSKRPTKAERFGLPMGPAAEKLYAAGILLTMWMVGLFLGWFLMLFAVPPSQALDVFFEVFSATSNAGLGTGIMGSQFSDTGKFVYIVLMWIGRLEILPALILIWSILFPFGRKRERRKNAAAR